VAGNQQPGNPDIGATYEPPNPATYEPEEGFVMPRVPAAPEPAAPEPAAPEPAAPEPRPLDCDCEKSLDKLRKDLATVANAATESLSYKDRIDALDSRLSVLENATFTVEVVSPGGDLLTGEVRIKDGLLHLDLSKIGR